MQEADMEFDGYVTLEIFLSYGVYTGADLNDFMMSDKESDGYACLDAYSVFGKIARLPGRAGSGDIALSVVLSASNPLEPQKINLLAADLCRYFEKKILPILAAKRVDLYSPDVSIPVDIDFTDADQNSELFLSLDANDECFAGLIPKLESLCLKARQNGLKEMSVYRDDKGKWKISGSAEKDNEEES